MNDSICHDLEFDARGLMCPEPIMMLHGKVRDMASGEVLKVVATDPATQRDVPKFCHYLGHELLLAEEIESHYVFWIKKA